METFLAEPKTLYWETFLVGESSKRDQHKCLIGGPIGLGDATLSISLVRKLVIEAALEL